jgi:hypothetical protein
MASSSGSHDRPDDVRDTRDQDAKRDDPYLDSEPLDPEKPVAEEPAIGVEDVIEFFDREPPERPASDADAQPPFG